MFNCLANCVAVFKRVLNILIEIDTGQHIADHIKNNNTILASGEKPCQAHPMYIMLQDEVLFRKRK